MEQMRFNSRWWYVLLPPGWQATQGSECVTLSSGHYPSALQISAAKKDAPNLITDEDLKDFAANQRPDELRLRKIDTPPFQGFYAEHVENGVFWREWWLRAGGLMIYVSYNVEETFKDTETVFVDNIVKSLRPLELGQRR